MRTSDLSRLATTLLAGFLAACGGAGAGPDPTADTVVSIRVEPSLGRLVEPGDSLRFEAFGTRGDGGSAEVAVTWSTSDRLVATIGTDGWAIARTEGFVIVAAEASALRGAATLLVNSDTVPPALKSVFADPSRLSVFQRTGTVLLQAEFADSGSGAKSALALFEGPFGQSVTGLVSMSEVLPSGTADTLPTGHALFRGTLEIPANTGVGLWVLSALRADDRAGNRSVWGRADLERLGHPVEVIAVLGGS